MSAAGLLAETCVAGNAVTARAAPVRATGSAKAEDDPVADREEVAGRRHREPRRRRSLRDPAGRSAPANQSPRAMCRSEWHTPAALILTSASMGPGLGFGTSSIRSAPSWRCAASMGLVLSIVRPDRVAADRIPPSCMLPLASLRCAPVRRGVQRQVHVSAPFPRSARLGDCVGRRRHDRHGVGYRDRVSGRDYADRWSVCGQERGRSAGGRSRAVSVHRR